MDPPPVPNASFGEAPSNEASSLSRSQSFSQKSDDSQTAAEFISSQLQLEAEAREALPYSPDDCTKPLGALRQILFSCLTCNPPPANVTDPYIPAGFCYSCSIQCHGEHELVELFHKRNFVCDCGTTRLPATSPCTLRINPETNTQGAVHSEVPHPGNKYNHNFRNRFCGCGRDYDAYKEKGTMFQCLGLGITEDGGCGEDWWHPGCVVGLGPDWHDQSSSKGTLQKPRMEGLLTSITEVAEEAVNENAIKHTETEPSIDAAAELSNSMAAVEPQNAPMEEETEDPPLPPGFPEEDDFEGFICYKCVESNSWIKRYAGAPGFLPAVFKRSAAPSPETGILGKVEELATGNSRKRKAEDDLDSESFTGLKRPKEETSNTIPKQPASNPAELLADDKPACKVRSLPPAPTGKFSLFFKEDFRDHLCRCPDCFPKLKNHEQLLEVEEAYQPPLSESGDDGAGGSTIGSGSIYERGESALKNVDRVRAIEGVMAYNHLKDKLKPFFQQFAESGQAISAEDIKAHFAKMRGDEQAIKDAGEGAKHGDDRKEQSGY